MAEHSDHSDKHFFYFCLLPVHRLMIETCIRLPCQERRGFSHQMQDCDDAANDWPWKLEPSQQCRPLKTLTTRLEIPTSYRMQKQDAHPRSHQAISHASLKRNRGKVKRKVTSLATQNPTLHKPQRYTKTITNDATRPRPEGPPIPDSCLPPKGPAIQSGMPLLFTQTTASLVK